MKWPLSLLPCLLAFHCLAQSQSASLTAYCRSLSLYSATAFSGAAPLVFTTAHSGTGLPQYVPGNPPVFSGELRPHAGQAGVYDTDYAVLSGNNLSQYGAFSLALPSGDTNHDGIPELIDLAQPMYCDALGTGQNTWPTTNTSTLNLRFSRPAGSPTGAFSGIWNISGSGSIVNGSLSLELLQGNVTYTRGRTNQLQLVLTRVMLNGTTNTLTGTVNYTATANQLSLPRFNLSSTLALTNIITLTDTNTLTSTNIVTITNVPGPTYTAEHCVLNRHGSRYTGNLSFVDGAPETPWPDYLNWVVSITDTNDADTNGIPDLSDPNVVQLPSAPLLVTTNGSGSVSPALSGQNLVLGNTYRLTATPAVGYLFGGWFAGGSGELVSSARTLSFVMVTNLNLQADFVPNPFYPVSGSYYGLVEDTNTLAFESRGAFTARTTANGLYSVKLQLGGHTYSLSGGLDDSGSSYKVIVPSSMQPLFVSLHLDLINNTGFSGTVSNGEWSATISANKAGFNARSNPCAFAGRYTIARPSYGAYGALPLGSSYGTVNVDAWGHIRCALWLADGTRANQSTVLSATGDWPLFISLYGGKGCLEGWLTLTNSQEFPISGLLAWFKPANTAKYARQGVTNLVTWVASPYTPPAAGTPPVNWTNGVAVFEGGNLPDTFTEDLTLDSHFKLISTETNHFSVQLLKNGLFQGRIIPPGATRPVSFQGALIQLIDEGFGYVPGPTASGGVQLGQLTLPTAPGPNTNWPGGPPGVPEPVQTNTLPDPTQGRLISGTPLSGPFNFDTNLMTAPVLIAPVTAPPPVYPPPANISSGAEAGMAGIESVAGWRQRALYPRPVP